MHTNSNSSRRAGQPVVHPVSKQDAAAMAALREIVLPNKGKLRGIAARPIFADIIEHTVAPADVAFREDVVGGVSGWWCEPLEITSDGVILHLHGGWFAWGSATAFRNLVGHIARSAGMRAFIPDYGLAPEHPFPTAIYQVEAVFADLAQRGFGRICLTGDSAGGNLVLSLLSLLAAKAPDQLSHVAAAAVLSPVTDLTQSGASWQERAEAEPFFVFDQASGLIASYLQGAKSNDPIASPLFADHRGLPPIRVDVGDDEVLLDDSLRYVKRAATAGVDAEAHVWASMPHGFLGSVGSLDAADECLQAIGSFLRARLG